MFCALISSHRRTRVPKMDSKSLPLITAPRLVLRWISKDWDFNVKVFCVNAGT